MTQKEMVLSIYPHAEVIFFSKNNSGVCQIINDETGKPLSSMRIFECYAWEEAAELIEKDMLRRLES